ncbi:hypothetical protein KY389_09805 [Paracoccus bogoriensis]|uniref:hypothetical protein n=1 Tax=Paracoccus bogoriensis TaxID=242065 RepID=UPI001CA518E0|nr:hypothetical protein [Paracoccus bogoriensis]MBW7056986.1 hypothetical protein [Paracoccus bogoriensis]
MSEHYQTTHYSNRQSEIVMPNTYMTITEAATPHKHGAVTVQFNGLTVHVGFDIHAEVPVDQKEDLIRMAALRCVADFFDSYRGAQALESEAV